MENLFVFLTLIFASPLGWAHGQISLVECYSSKAEIRLRVEAKKGSSDLQLLTFAANDQVEKTLQPVKVLIKDKIIGKKIVEEITISANEYTLNLKIPENYAHKIRKGEGRLLVGKPEPNPMFSSKNCYLVYKN